MVIPMKLQGNIERHTLKVIILCIKAWKILQASFWIKRLTLEMIISQAAPNLWNPMNMWWIKRRTSNNLCRLHKYLCISLHVKSCPLSLLISSDNWLSGKVIIFIRTSSIFRTMIQKIQWIAPAHSESVASKKHPKRRYFELSKN